MKKIKIAFWGLILALVAVFGYQNWDFLKAKQILLFKVPFLQQAWHTPELPHAVLFLVFFLTGFLIAYFTSLYERFKTKKTIKNLNAAATSQLEELVSLKQELESLRKGTAAAGADGATPAAQDSPSV